MNIFNTIYKGEYKNTLRSLRFNLLQKLAGANAAKFECFRPVIGGLPTQQHEQERKAEFVQLFIDMINAGVNFDTLPTGCGCEDLVGNVCTIAGAGYAELAAGITASTKQSIVTACTSTLGEGDVSFEFTIPDGAVLIGTVLKGEPLNAGSDAITILSTVQAGQTVTVNLTDAVDSGDPQLCYSYSINA
jgi:hypothetical protein